MDKDLVLKEKKELELQINTLIEKFTEKTGFKVDAIEIMYNEMNEFKKLKLKFSI